ncbi:hypothetical protein SAMN05519104_3657 [Rhizobiales bacterium GAS188]|nr:hypothetical protein SAMN05519104_3657 [Rhizobiales bacterium GAS188]
MRGPFFVSLCLLLCAFRGISPALADSCPGPNAQRIQDAQFDFTYESWIIGTNNLFGVNTYGRCVAVLNQQNIAVDWIGTQLKGQAAPDKPILVTFPFVNLVTKEAPSELRYGSTDPPTKSKSVNFLANTGELSPGQSQVAARVLQLRAQMFNGLGGDPSFFAATTHAQINVTNLENSITGTLNVILVSQIDLLEPIYTYKITYSVTGDLPSGGLLMRPQSKYFATVIGPDGATNLDGKGGNINRGFSGSKVDHERTTMLFDRFDLVDRDGRLVAAFPVSYYGPP